MSADPVIPLSALEHHVYCPRQCALIHVDGVWAANEHTVSGERFHRRVDTALSRQERGRQVLRGIPLYSERLGLTGRADAVEVTEDGDLRPVEYKSGTPHGRAADVQVCAQGLCLEEMTGRTVQSGFVWYGGVRRRRQVSLDDQLRTLTVQAIEAVRQALVSGQLPGAVNDERCGHCQLEPMCMPRVVASGAAERYLREQVLACD